MESQPSLWMANLLWQGPINENVQKVHLNYNSFSRGYMLICCINVSSVSVPGITKICKANLGFRKGLAGICKPSSSCLWVNYVLWKLSHLRSPQNINGGNTFLIVQNQLAYLPFGCKSCLWSKTVTDCVKLAVDWSCMLNSCKQVRKGRRRGIKYTCQGLLYCARSKKPQLSCVECSGLFPFSLLLDKLLLCEAVFDLFFCSTRITYLEMLYPYCVLCITQKFSEGNMHG